MFRSFPLTSTNFSGHKVENKDLRKIKVPKSVYRKWSIWGGGIPEKGQRPNWIDPMGLGRVGDLSNFEIAHVFGKKYLDVILGKHILACEEAVAYVHYAVTGQKSHLIHRVM